MNNPSTQAALEQEELRLLLKEKGILHSGKDEQIKTRDGQSAPWMFYSWAATLTHRGAILAASCLLEKLKKFKSTQLATFGYTGMPLLSSCILLGEGKYTGISIREERKAYGSARKIEGPVDKSKSVVLIDDSISSGTAMIKGIKALEEEGFIVEGGLCLVNFPWRGGTERVQGLGYRMETIFDIWNDLEMPRPVFTPVFQRIMPKEWGEIQIQDGLHPAHAARSIAEIYLAQKTVPRPPRCFDKSYEAPGGTFVSFRYRETDHRLVRDGFWHFNPSDADPCRDLVLATIKTVQASQGKLTEETLKKLKIAVTFFGPLEKIPPAKLDFSQYGIVVRSRAYESKMGGALPNTQVFTNEIDQYHHARVRNARISDYEPHDIYRHTLEKCVEPGEYWLPYGFPVDPSKDWYNDESLGNVLTKRAQEYLQALSTGSTSGQPVPENLIPATVYAVSVTLYHKGIVGCGVAWSDTLDACIGKAAASAYHDKRFQGKKTGVEIQDMWISVSLLHDREWLGQTSMQEAVKKMRRGLDSLSVQQGKHIAIFLPVVAPYYNWSKEQVVQELLKKAGITSPPYVWSTYKTGTWLRKGGRIWKLTFGFPDRSEQSIGPEKWKDEMILLGNYICSHIETDSLPEYLYFPVTGRRVQKGTAPRTVHPFSALLEAGQILNQPSWRETADKGLQAFCQYLKTENGEALLAFQGKHGSPMAECILLAAMAKSNQEELKGAPFHMLAKRVCGFFRPDGRITSAPDSRSMEIDHDFFPGAALVALGAYASAASDLSSLVSLDAQFEWYKRRFRALHPWGMVGWQTQGWAALYLLTGRQEYADFVFEMADWALDWQHEKTGAFLTELHPYGLSFHTLFLSEGIADAWKIALCLEDKSRIDRYAISCKSAARFLNQLLIRPEDTFCMADPNKAVGGVRGSLSSSEVRIDYVSHALIALAKFWKNLESEKLT